MFLRINFFQIGYSQQSNKTYNFRKILILKYGTRRSARNVLPISSFVESNCGHDSWLTRAISLWRVIHSPEKTGFTRTRISFQTCLGISWTGKALHVAYTAFVESIQTC